MRISTMDASYVYDNGTTVQTKKYIYNRTFKKILSRTIPCAELNQGEMLIPISIRTLYNWIDPISGG
jgi:hypothetical protein